MTAPGRGPAQTHGWSAEGSDGEALAGFTVAVTSDRRRDELATMLERYGARIVHVPALRLVPLSDDSSLRETTRVLLAAPPDAVIASTAIGVVGWLEAADSWGLGDALRARLATTHVVARWPRASGELRPEGLLHVWSPDSESSAEVLDHLTVALAGPAGARQRARRAVPAQRAGAAAGAAGAASGRAARPLAGRRVAVQLHGEPQEDLCSALRAAGAEVIEVPVYRWAPPVDPTPLHRLVDLITNQLVDAVTFTSAAAVGSVLHVAGPSTDAVLAALRGPVLAPPRAGINALVTALVDELPRRTTSLRVAGSELVLRGHAAVVDGVLTPLPPAQMAILRALAAEPGRVLARSALLESLPRGADEHAVEMAVARLRAALGRSTYIQTVVKRGYRLRVD